MARLSSRFGPMRGVPSTVVVNGRLFGMSSVLLQCKRMTTALAERSLQAPSAPPTDLGTPKRLSTTRPFHEAVSRRTRRAQHNRQVFGLAGVRIALLLAVASRGSPSAERRRSFRHTAAGQFRSHTGFPLVVADQSAGAP